MNSTVAIPKRMAHLEKDVRGYPIPANVLRDAQGKPHFAINPDHKRFLLFQDDQCSICGTKLMRLRWFVGGPLSAFHPDGAYIDPPLHRDCMRYAMQVCPYLAMSNYSKAIGHRTSKDERLTFVDPTMIPGRPSVFVCVGATDQTVNYSSNRPGLGISVRPKRPYAALEFWKDGKQIPREIALDMPVDRLKYEIPA